MLIRTHVCWAVGRISHTRTTRVRSPVLGLRVLSQQRPQFQPPYRSQILPNLVGILGLRRQAASASSWASIAACTVGPRRPNKPAIWYLEWSAMHAWPSPPPVPDHQPQPPPPTGPACSPLGLRYGEPHRPLCSSPHPAPRVLAADRWIRSGRGPPEFVQTQPRGPPHRAERSRPGSVISAAHPPDPRPQTSRRPCNTHEYPRTTGARRESPGSRDAGSGACERHSSRTGRFSKPLDAKFSV
jgi:hypothetical protein